MTGMLLPDVINRLADSGNKPVSGGSATFYYTGTTNLAPIYSDTSLTTALTNPIATNSAGLYVNGSGTLVSIYLDKTITYKLVVKDAAGAVIRTIDPLSFGLSSEQFKSVTDYGAKGDGSTDDAAAIQAAVSALSEIVFPAGKTFLIGTAISIPSGRTLRMHGATLKLKNSANAHVLLVASGASDVTIEGGVIDGNKLNNASGGSGIATTGSGAIRLKVTDVTVHDCKANGVYVGGASASDVIIKGVTSYNNGLAGITLDATVNRFEIGQCTAYLNGTHGIGFIGIATNGGITGCTASGNGAGGVADNFTGYNYQCRNITIANNTSKSSGNNGFHFGGSDITYTGNSDEDAAQYGFVHYGSDGATTQTSTGVTMTGNRSKGAGNAGFWWDKVNEGTFGSNGATGTLVGVGATFTTCTKVSITGNEFCGIPNSAIRVSGGCTKMTITGNTCTDNTAGHGIYVSDLTLSTIAVNTCTGNSGYGIREDGASNFNQISPNMLHGNTTGTLLTVGANTVITPNLS